MAAAHYHASRLIAIVDHNKYQQTGPISREMTLTPLAEKWRAFGWRVEEVDGHDVGAVIEKLRKIAPAPAPPADHAGLRTPGLPAHTAELCSSVSIPGPRPVRPSRAGLGHAARGWEEEKGPSVLIAHTVKGKGVSFMEGDYTWHGWSLTPEQDARAREELRATR